METRKIKKKTELWRSISDLHSRKQIHIVTGILLNTGNYFNNVRQGIYKDKETLFSLIVLHEIFQSKNVVTNFNNKKSKPCYSGNKILYFICKFGLENFHRKGVVRLFAIKGEVYNMN